MQKKRLDVHASGCEGSKAGAFRTHQQLPSTFIHVNLAQPRTHHSTKMLRLLDLRVWALSCVSMFARDFAFAHVPDLVFVLELRRMLIPQSSKPILVLHYDDTVHECVISSPWCVHAPPVTLSLPLASPSPLSPRPTYRRAREQRASIFARTAATSVVQAVQPCM